MEHEEPTRSVVPGADIDLIHDGTAIYTCDDEIDTLLDAVGWPTRGGGMMDPGCGDGNMLVRAMKRLAPRPGDHEQAERITGYEFHLPSVHRARERLADVLRECGWSDGEAKRAASRCVEARDYLLNPPSGSWDLILANPPYWRRANLPEAYRTAFDAAVPPHARQDLLHAYLDRMLTHLTEGGAMAVVTSDRWLLNSSAAGIRAAIGCRLRVMQCERLDTRSAFHRPKERSRGTPPRVHAVGMVLTTEGREIGRQPFRIEEVPAIDGVPLCNLVQLRLAPWLGPDGIFVVGPNSGLPEEHLVPCVEPADICPRTDRIGPIRRWAIVTDERLPPSDIVGHLDGQLARMPARGRRRVRWLPPERFDGRLPLPVDAVLIPRLAPRLRAVRLPANHLPTNHSLVVASGLPVHTIQRMLADPRVQAQADALALRVESGYRSYTATILNQIVIPYDLMEDERIAA